MSKRYSKYAILEVDKSGYEAVLRRVKFNYARVVEAIKAAYHPSEF